MFQYVNFWSELVSEEVLAQCPLDHLVVVEPIGQVRMLCEKFRMVVAAGIDIEVAPIDLIAWACHTVEARKHYTPYSQKPYSPNPKPGIVYVCCRTCFACMHACFFRQASHAQQTMSAARPKRKRDWLGRHRGGHQSSGASRERTPSKSKSRISKQHLSRTSGTPLGRSQVHLPASF